MKNIRIEKQSESIIYYVYNINGELIGTIPKEQEGSLSVEEWLKGVSCFVINEYTEVLIEKRVSKGLTPGKLDLCSGHIDGNELAIQAIIRELAEELGIGIEKSSNVKRVSEEECPLGFESNGKIRNFFISFYCLQVKKEDVKFNRDEVEAIAWLPKQKAFELIRRGETKFPKWFDYEQIFNSVKNICNGKKQEDEERE